MEPLFVLFTLAMLSAAILAGVHALREGYLAFYGVSLVYGFVLEQLVILQFDTYAYPVDAYLLTLFDVPLAISFGWGAILYTGFAVATRYGLSSARIPAFAALFALHIDLSMDVVAAGVGYWTWLDGGLWFGVPLGNFFGWFCVTGFYTGSYLLARSRVDSGLLAAVAAVLASLALLLLSLELWTRLLWSPASEAVVLALLVGGALGVLARSAYDPSPIPVGLQYATLVFHGFFLALYLATGMLFDPAFVLLAPIALATFAIGYVVVHQPSLDSLGRLRGRIRRWSRRRGGADAPPRTD